MRKRELDIYGGGGRRGLEEGKDRERMRRVLGGRDNKKIIQ